MKKRLFAGCIWAVVLAGLFVHLRDPLIEWLHSSDSATAKELLEKGYSTNLMELGNALHDFLFPGLAAGFAGCVMARKLRLWQGCFLCLLLPLSASVFQCVIMPAVPSFDLASVKVTAVPFNYIVSWSHVFPIFSIALVFYGILHKDRLTAALNVSWHFCWHIFLYLLSPLFPQFDRNKLRMDHGELTQRTILFALEYAAIFLLLFLAVRDFYKEKKNGLANLEQS